MGLLCLLMVGRHLGHSNYTLNRCLNNPLYLLQSGLYNVNHFLHLYAEIYPKILRSN